jgi:hypothetical protein
MAITYKANGNGTKTAWLHDGKSVLRMRELSGDVVSLTADGDELQAVRYQFTGILMHHGRSEVTWSGETARFIATNLQ